MHADVPQSHRRPCRDAEVEVDLPPRRSFPTNSTVTQSNPAGPYICRIDTRLGELAAQVNPVLLQLPGVGPLVASQLLVACGDNPERLSSEQQFAALCGTAPIPASSGKHQRHRLSRGGDRTANSAIHRIVLVRMSAGDTRTGRLHCATHSGRQVRARDHPLPQTLRRARVFQDHPESAASE
ncbi:MAG: IS110 family transposase [Rhodococcus sp. (in: high G+C Gram-positive bacteria)]|nr:MAG: IS110 family transposase [Rhodococcus sp. (in: high G+C Gram-positive bacteria)]